jgi:hypothetical protein
MAVIIYIIRLMQLQPANNMLLAVGKELVQNPNTAKLNQIPLLLKNCPIWFLSRKLRTISSRVIEHQKNIKTAQTYEQKLNVGQVVE